jgi:HlyD family secretion protein
MPIQEQAELRSEGIREFISHRPGFIIRWGIPVFFFVLVAIATGSWFIQYPDIVHAQARVNSINAPKQVIAKKGGRLVKLFKGDNWEIKQGDIIGYIESTARHDEVLYLSAILDTLQYFADSNRLEEIPRFWNSSNQSFAHLGELQQTQQAFMQGYISFKDYLGSGFYIAKKKMLLKDLNNTKKLLQTLYEQKNFQQQDMELTVQNYNVHDTLHNETLINDLDFRNQKSQLLNKKMNVPQMNAAIINNQNQQNGLQKEMMEAENQIIQQKAIFIQLLNTYKSTVEEWKQKFLLLAPVTGKFVYASFLEENQQLQTGQVIGFITNESNQYFVEMLIPQTNFGKVRPGQAVLLKFPSYPAPEFGSVKGKIEYIKSVPADSGYLAKVSLPNGLVTNYKKILYFNQGMMAQAEIITERRRLSDRFIKGLRDLIE